MKRAHYINRISALTRQFPAVCLLGPRRVGKTTLARDWAGKAEKIFPSIHVFDLEDPADLAALENPRLVLGQLEGLIVIDEIQRCPDLFPILRVLIDAVPRKQQWLILGSASRELLRQSSETLAGRIAYLEICPFSLVEADHDYVLWLRGGFPESLLSATDEESFEWRKHYVRTFLEQDIPGLGIRIAPASLRRFWMMMAHYHGNIFNAEELSRSLGVNSKSVRHYLDVLTGTFMLRQLQPWWENISKRQVKSPKIYFRDSGLLHCLLDIGNRDILQRHPRVGASWEGYALEEIIRCLNIDAESCYFWATHQEAELDLLIFDKGKRLGFEFKYADAPKLTKSMRVACDTLQLDTLTVIYPGTRKYQLAENMTVVNLASYIEANNNGDNESG